MWRGCLYLYYVYIKPQSHPLAYEFSTEFDEFETLSGGRLLPTWRGDPSLMYALGHIGIALLVFAPLGAFLLVTDRVRLAGAGAALTVSVSTLPDLDLFVAALSHRGLTHTLAFAILAGAALGAVASGSLTRRLPRRSAVRAGLWVWLTTALSMCSHLLGDAMTPMGIRPFAPGSDAFLTLSLVYSRNPQVNATLLLAGGVTTAAYWWHGIGAGRRVAAWKAVRTSPFALRDRAMGRVPVAEMISLLSMGHRR